jgi:hypothetical protein
MVDAPSEKAEDEKAIILKELAYWKYVTIERPVR